MLSAVVIVLGGLAWWRPADALILVTAIAPFGGILALLSGTHDTWTLPLAFAVVVGASIRESRRPEPNAGWAAATATWYATVAASMLVGLLEDAPGRGPGYWPGVGRWLLTGFPIADSHLYLGIRGAVIAIVGVQLAALVAKVVRRDPPVAIRLLKAALLGTAAVGVLSSSRLVEIALRRPPFLTTLLAGLRNLRISAAFPDVNAASALYLLMLPVAIEGVRRPASRRWALPALPCLLAGLWLTGSRTSLVLVPVLAVITVWLVADRVRLSRSRRIAAAVFVVVLGALFFASHPRSLRSSNALSIREEMAMATGRMVAAAPLFGVGIGQYRASSPGFMSNRVRQWYPAQNAHNQFLQVLGELGFTGLLVFGALLTLALGNSTWQVLARTVPDGATGAVVGLWGFLVTSLTMHPLLVPEAGMVFWILVGVARGTSSTRVPTWLEEAAFWWMALLVLTLPLRVEGYL
jgi:hypothetical protein